MTHSGPVFNERTHAFVIASFYQCLKAAQQERGVACFVKATQRMAEQRGLRMALRALRDGQPLNYNTYMAYSEITFTIPGEKSMTGEYPHCEMLIHTCPWHDVFREMGLLECGLVYCPEIDRGIIRGFHPDLGFQLKSLLHNSPCCDMVFENAALDGSDAAGPEAKKGWDYHCGHVYRTFRECIEDVFPDSDAILAQTDALLSDGLGAEALDLLRTYLTVDFNRIESISEK